MALHILEQAYRNGDIQPGTTIVEATSGNTGIAFAAIGRALGPFFPVSLRTSGRVENEFLFDVLNQGYGSDRKRANVSKCF